MVLLIVKSGVYNNTNKMGGNTTPPEFDYMRQNTNENLK